MNQHKRYQSLDILRGLCALFIMIYHYSWFILGHKFKADNILGRFGVYGVSLFYVLSGLTMFLVYFDKFSFSLSFFKDFYIKRSFRIFPLMWLVMIGSYFVFGTDNTWREQLIIATGLFSVFDWNANTPMGMWSIGNELSFYLMLPFIFWSLKKGRMAGILISLLIFFAYLYSAYVVDDKEGNYKNPLNQAGLFLGGVLIGLWFNEVKIKPVYAGIIALTGLLLFSLLPAHGEMQIVYIGNYRVAFTFICFVITLGFLKMNVENLNEKIKSVFLWLGEISYSLYLIHGLVWGIIVLTGIKIRFVLPLSIAGTFILSYVVNTYLESPARRFGYKVLKGNKKTCKFTFYNNLIWT